MWISKKNLKERDKKNYELGKLRGVFEECHRQIDYTNTLKMFDGNVEDLFGCCDTLAEIDKLLKESRK